MRPDALRSLVRDLNTPAGRARRGRLFVEGVRFVHRAADAGALERLVVSKALLRSPPGQRLVRHRARDGVPVTRVTPEQFRSLSTAQRASGLAAIVRTPWRSLADLGPGPLLVVRRLRSNGNLGTLMRSADALGAGGLVVIGDAVDPWSPDVVRASMGSVFGLPIVRCSLPDLLALDRRLLAADADGSIALGHDPLPPRVAFFLGDERKGIAPEDRRRCHGAVRIPMVGSVDSLNVAQAGTVLLYEATRQAPK